MSGSKTDINEVFEAMRGRIGKEMYSQTFVLSRTDIRKYCIAVGISRPEHEDAEAAHKLGYSDVCAPLSMYGGITMTRLVDKKDMQPDGVAGDLGLGDLASMVGEASFDFEGPAIAGEPLHLRRSIKGVEMKTGRSGKMMMIRHEARFEDDSGLRLATFRFTQVVR